VSALGAGIGAPTAGQWFRVAALKPRLHPHLRLHRHVYRGQVWQVLDDPVSHRQHRFNRATWRLLRRFDGQHSVADIWTQAQQTQAGDAPTQDDIVALLGQLNASDLLSFDVSPDVAELFERGRRQRQQRWRSRLLNPMSLRFPLWDPDRLLGRWVDGARWLPATAVAAVWAAVVLGALVALPSHWAELTHGFADRVLAAENLLLLAVIFPLLKAAHELAHAWAVKLRGGEVHEMGLMLLLFYPVPYVDASAANAFVSKRHRMLVGAAGMLAELWIAALAFGLWLLLEPGLARSIAFNVMLVGSISTVAFNANPLLRYDGYYLLADAAELPNLGQRANAHWQALISQRVFGAPASPAGTSTRSEQRWFFAYAPTALVYRLWLTLTIAVFLAQHYLVVGVLLAVWSVASSVVLPLGKGLRAVLTAPQFQLRRQQVRLTLLGTALGAALLLFAVPMPHHTPAEGVVALPEGALLRAGADGWVEAMLLTAPADVGAADPVLRQLAPELTAEVLAQQARLEEAQARVDASWARPAEQGRWAETAQREQAALAQLQRRQGLLTLRATLPGRLVIEREQDLPGRYLRRGDVIGYVNGQGSSAATPRVQVVLPQLAADAVRRGVVSVAVRLPQDLGTVYPAQLLRQLPKAGKTLPSPALGSGGGGRVPSDARQPDGTQAMEALFEVELAVPALREHIEQALGSHAWVRFEHAPQPLGWRWLRALRAQFLSRWPQ
jgi:putative peptide zinc metalloprotease protein